MANTFPVYGIQKFKASHSPGDFYANFLKPHVDEHHFTNLPHKHDFYLVVLFTAGKGTHEVDFESYKVGKGSLFIMKPGQMHYWELSDDIDGYVFFHSRDFYDKGFLVSGIKDFNFYNSFQTSPFIKLKNKPLETVSDLMQEVVKEYKNNDMLKWQKVHALISLVYIEISRQYAPLEIAKNETYLLKVKKFEDLLEEHFKRLKFPKDYADKLHITEKHLNRIVKDCLNKTSTEIIGERILLEAKRMLMHSTNSVTQIADELGYKDVSYFVRFFKKNTGETPLSFLNKHTRY